jgi:hypothetical protein
MVAAPDHPLARGRWSGWCGAAVLFGASARHARPSRDRLGGRHGRLRGRGRRGGRSRWRSRGYRRGRRCRTVLVVVALLAVTGLQLTVGVRVALLRRRGRRADRERKGRGCEHNDRQLCDGLLQRPPLSWHGCPGFRGVGAGARSTHDADHAVRRSLPCPRETPKTFLHDSSRAVKQDPAGERFVPLGDVRPQRSERTDTCTAAPGASTRADAARPTVDLRRSPRSKQVLLSHTVSCGAVGLARNAVRDGGSPDAPAPTCHPTLRTAWDGQHALGIRPDLAGPAGGLLVRQGNAPRWLRPVDVCPSLCSGRAPAIPDRRRIRARARPQTR